jgi:fumarate reductase subunit D
MEKKPSNDPFFWAFFGAGGTLTAFLSPVMILITGILVPIGLLGSNAMSYERMLAFVGNPLIKLILLAVIFLSLWHAGHRIYFTAHELGVHPSTGLKVACYGVSVIVTLVALIFMLQI